MCEENKENQVSTVKPETENAGKEIPAGTVSDPETKKDEPEKPAEGVKAETSQNAEKKRHEASSDGDGAVPPSDPRPGKNEPKKSHRKIGRIILKYVLVFVIAGGGAFAGSYAAIKVHEKQMEKQMTQAFGSLNGRFEAPGNGSENESSGAALGITIEQTDDGIEIVGFADNSNAEKAGLEKGDIITAVDGKSYDSVSAISSYISARNVGDKVKVTVRRDGKESTYSVKLVKKDLSAYSIPALPDQNSDDSSGSQSAPKALPGTNGDSAQLQG